MDFLGRAKWMTAEVEDGFYLDFGNDKLRLRGLFKGIKDLIDIASKLREVTEETKNKAEIRGLQKQVGGVYGLSDQTLKAQRPIIKPLGNIKEPPKGVVIEEVREPIVDIFDEKRRFLVITEMPGVSEGEINIDIMGDILLLLGSNKKRKYAKETLLPAKVKKETMKVTYKNGILEITIEKL